jgi:hypothetical protein
MKNKNNPSEFFIGNRLSWGPNSIKVTGNKGFVFPDAEDFAFEDIENLDIEDLEYANN